MPLYTTEAFLNLYKEVHKMKKLNNHPYGALELKGQIKNSTLKGFVLSLMFFIVIGFVGSSLQSFIKDEIPPILIDIETTVVTNYSIENNIEQATSGEGAKAEKSVRNDIGLNQKFTEEIDLPVIKTSILDVGINPDEILKNIGNALGINGSSGVGNGNLTVETNNTNNIKSDLPSDITKEFVHQDLQKFPSMDYDKIKSFVHYPQQAKVLNLSGVVHIAALIDKSGKLTKSYIYSSTNSLFDEEALQAVRNYNDFSPAVHNERTVDCWIIIPIKFKLK